MKELIPVERLQNSSGVTSKTSSDQSSYKKESSIERIFGAFALIYGHRFISQYPTKDSQERAKKLWAKGLSRLDQQSIKRGVNYCLHISENIFPPSLPEFRMWCMPTMKDLGLPELHEAYQLAISGNLANPVVYHAVEKIGSFNLRQMSYEASFKKFSEIYKMLVKSALSGEKFLLTIHMRKDLCDQKG